LRPVSCHRLHLLLLLLLAALQVLLLQLQLLHLPHPPQLLTHCCCALTHPMNQLT
jgi:hypothetical protein